MARPDSGIEWLLTRLSLMADDVAWTVGQVPEARLDTSPPGGDGGSLGAWPAHRHLFHLQ